MHTLQRCPTAAAAASTPRVQAQLVPLYEGDAFSVQSADPQNVDASTAFIMRLKVSCV